MKRVSVTALLLCASVWMTGCQRNARHVAAVPPLPPDVTPQMVSVPPPTHPSEPLPSKPVVPTATVTPPSDPPKKVRRPRKPAATAASSAPNTPAVSSAPPAVQTATTASPSTTLGVLSTGGESAGPGAQEAASLVHSLEARFSALPASAQNEHKTEVEQVKRFLQQAEDALKSSDTEGARTLATKAKVLLDEIQQ